MRTAISSGVLALVFLLGGFISLAYAAEAGPTKGVTGGGLHPQCVKWVQCVNAKKCAKNSPWACNVSTPIGNAIGICQLDQICKGVTAPGLSGGQNNLFQSANQVF